MSLLLGQYQLGEVIGRGAFGFVHRALNVKTGDFVAVKKYEMAEVPEKELQQIVEEANLMKSLDHENVVQFYGATRDETSLYLIMEYVENGSVNNIMTTFGKFPESLVRVYTEQVLKGLEYLHSNGVLHRDIKGCNILVTKEGTTKLADFGVSAKVDETQKKFSIVGTPYWMAPEVIEMAGCGLPSDIWSVGCTIIELLTGSPPYYELASMTALFRIVKDPHPPFPDDVSPELREFLLSVFQRDPAQRPTAPQLLTHPWITNPKCAAASGARPSPLRRKKKTPHPVFGLESDEESDLSAAICEGNYVELLDQKDQLQTEVEELKENMKKMTLQLLTAAAEKGEALKIARFCVSKNLSPQQQVAIEQRINQLEKSSNVDIGEIPRPNLSSGPSPGPSSASSSSSGVGSAPGRNEGGPPSQKPPKPPKKPQPSATKFSQFQAREPQYQDAQGPQSFITPQTMRQAAERQASWGAHQYADSSYH